MVTPLEIQAFIQPFLDFIGTPISSGSKVTIGLLAVIVIYIYIMSKW